MRCAQVSRAMLAALFLLTACGPSPWEQAQQANTVEAFETFVQANPQSEFAPIALTRIDELLWVEASTANSIETYERYLAKHPDGSHSAAAHLQIADLRWQAASAMNTVDGYADFVRSTADSNRIEQARAAIKVLHSSSAPETQVLVELDGIFADNTIKYVRNIGVQYQGQVAGVPATVNYSVGAGFDASGEQQYFAAQEGGAELALLAYPTVQGTIDLENTAHGKITLMLSGLVENAQKDLVGSYLVARDPQWLVSRTEGLEVAKAAHDTSVDTLKLDSAALFEVQSDFSLVYLP
jgi:hypothetical protein